MKANAMKATAMRTTAMCAMALVAISTPCLHAQDVQIREDELPDNKPNYSPCPEQHYPQNVYFEDTHLHTSWSAGAGMAGAKLGPETAYRVSRGEQVTSQTGWLYRRGSENGPMWFKGRSILKFRPLITWLSFNHGMNRE
ncbi:MAG: DUF3604 domain-containing protein [Xanthomonadales bacterium]|nr:DUF3604 domain-containing protein [Xanthomonadales bacterium]